MSIEVFNVDGVSLTRFSGGALGVCFQISSDSGHCQMTASEFKTFLENCVQRFGTNYCVISGVEHK